MQPILGFLPGPGASINAVPVLLIPLLWFRCPPARPQLLSVRPTSPCRRCGWPGGERSQVWPSVKLLESSPRWSGLSAAASQVPLLSSSPTPSFAVALSAAQLYPPRTSTDGHGNYIFKIFAGFSRENGTKKISGTVYSKYKCSLELSIPAVCVCLCKCVCVCERARDKAKDGERETGRENERERERERERQSERVCACMCVYDCVCLSVNNFLLS